MRITGIRFASSLLAALLVLCETDLPACTTAIVSAEASGTGRPLLWKQRDASDDFNTLAYVRGERYGYTALFPTSDLKHQNAYAGINEAGFAITNNLSYNLRPEEQGVGDTRNGALMSLALGRCRLVDEFEALLGAMERPMHLSANFGVLDAEGGAAYFEVSDTAYVRYDVPKGGYLFRTNFSISGDPARGRGFARYATMTDRMARARRLTPEFLLATGRSYVNVLEGGDALSGRRDGYLYEHDFIPRGTTTASIVIEGVAPGEDPSSGLMWCALGYTPACYAIPVWVAAGDRLPSVLTGEAPANRLAVQYKQSLRTLDWDSKYVEVHPLRVLLKDVRAAEKAEFKAGRKLDRQFRRQGFDAAAVTRFNEDTDRRFTRFQNRTSPIFSR